MSIKILARYTKFGDPYVRLRLSDGRVIGEHRFVMEKKLGRRLNRNEHVHHKDEKKRNNALGNLEVKSPAAHVRDHQRPARQVSLVCPGCGSNFTRPKRYVRSKRALGVKDLFCGRRCRRPLFGSIPSHAHGSSTGYNYWKCRCAVCKSWKAWQARARRAELRDQNLGRHVP